MGKSRLVSGVLAVILLVGVLGLAGCVKQENPNLKTYQEYVESLLDMSYHGEFDKYQEISGSSNGADVYAECITNYQNTLITCFAIDESVITDEQKDTLRSIATDLCSRAKYTVDEAVLTEDIYTVQVNVSSLNYFETANAGFDVFIDEFNEKAAQGYFLEATEEEYEAEYADGVIEVLKAALEESTYSDETSYTITILVNENGESYIGDLDLTAIDAMLFPSL